MADNHLGTLFITKVLMWIDTTGLIFCEKNRIFHFPDIMI